MEAVYLSRPTTSPIPTDTSGTTYPESPPTLAPSGGEVIVASGSARPLEGAAPGHTVVVRFPRRMRFAIGTTVTGYAPLKQLRVDSTANGFAVVATEFPQPIASS